VSAAAAQPLGVEQDEPTGGEAVLLLRGDDLEITDQLLAPLWAHWPWFKYALSVTGMGALALFSALGYTAVTGIGLWGNNIPVAWAFAIINFVWWIGIGHAGTFISAILLLLEVRWRTSINRFAEGMTLFAIVQAGLFPIFHLGRPWFAYWLIPYPAEMSVWPNFKSSLPWDVVAVTTYFTVSLLFWYTGLIPDLAAARDRAPTLLKRRVYGVFALGWRGDSRHWRHYRIGYLVLGGLATPLVLSVHSIISFDFAITQLPGWHSTIFPPYFVAGAIYSGFAMVVTLMVPARAVFKLEGVVTKNHLDNIAKMLLVTGWIVTYAYIVEAFMGWYGDNPYEAYTALVDRPRGTYALVYWGVIFCNCIVVQALWSRRIRTNPVALFAVAAFVQVGMWGERFMLIITSLHRDFLPSSWRVYTPSWIDWTILGGTCCFFLFLFLLFLRFVPFIPISEIKEMRHDLAKSLARREREVLIGAAPRVAPGRLGEHGA
jgi:Ni/Fe-hydrogenase subunit HybB-like protein